MPVPRSDFLSVGIQAEPTAGLTVASSLGKLREYGIISRDWNDVRGYAEQHSELALLLPAICQQARNLFGMETELALEVYRDPEITDRYLALYVRQASYGADIMNQIELVNQTFNGALENASGYFLVATDFRTPKGRNGI